MTHLNMFLYCYLEEICPLDTEAKPTIKGSLRQILHAYYKAQQQKTCIPHIFNENLSPSNRLT